MMEGNLTFTALETGDFRTALPLLENMTSDQLSELTCTLPDMCTPLHYACRHGRVDVAQQFITHCKYSIESEDVKGCTPLHTAAQYGQVRALKYLLHIANPLKIKTMSVLSNGYRDRSGNTPLHTACIHGQLDIVQLLTREIGCDPNDTNSEGLSYLHLAAQHGHLPLVRYVIEEVGSDVTLVDKHGRSPTYLAAGGGHLDILKYLIGEKGADPFFTVRKTAVTPCWSLVHRASYDGHLHAVRYLVEQHSCDPSRKDDKGVTPLHLACQQGHIQVVLYFAITHYCNLLIRDIENNTPFHLAARNGHLNIVKFVTEDMKCDPNCKGQFEATPLHLASSGGHLEVVKYLINTHNCDPLCLDKKKNTPLHYATANNREEVKSYLSRIANDRVLQEDNIIAPTLRAYVIGNSGAGKSTLVKALSMESIGSLLGKIATVKGVIPLTAGIVLTTIDSQVFGNVSIYDFAGHEEYYASIEILLQQTSHPLVLLTVDISLSWQEIERQLHYWLSMLPTTQNCHLVVIGSHADKIKMKSEMHLKLECLLSSQSSITYHGFISCDCRYYGSLNQLRQKLKSICRSVRLVLANEESYDSNKLCASLMYHLKHNIPEQATVTLGELRKQFKELKSIFFQQDLLIQTCKNLSINGHILFLPHDENPENSFLVLDEKKVLSKAQACLGFIKEELEDIMDESELECILSKTFEDGMDLYFAIRYLIFTQFCTEIPSDHLISASLDEKHVTHYFFPNLVLATRPPDLLPYSGRQTYTNFYTWCLKCTNAHQFFTPRYLHTLYIQIVKCDRDTANADYLIWKNGIMIIHSNGTRSIIEVTDQTTRVSLTIQCIEGHELQLVKQRSQLISLIKAIAHKVCPRVEVAEVLYVPQNTSPPDNPYEIPKANVACSILGTVSHNGEILQHPILRDVLYFDSFLVIGSPTLHTIFSHYQSNNVVPLATVTRIHSAVETCRELQEWFEDEAGQCRRDITYSQLYRELIKYSVFTEGNLFSLAGVEVLPVEGVADKELYNSVSTSVGYRSIFLPFSAAKIASSLPTSEVTPTSHTHSQLPSETTSTGHTSSSGSELSTSTSCTYSNETTPTKHTSASELSSEATPTNYTSSKTALAYLTPQITSTGLFSEVTPTSHTHSYDTTFTEHTPASELSIEGTPTYSHETMPAEHTPLCDVTPICHTSSPLPSETTPTGHRLSHKETTFTKHVPVSELSGEVYHTSSQLPSETTPTGHSPGHGLSHEATPISYTSSPLPSETTPTGHTPRLSHEETTFNEHVPVSELSGEVCHTSSPLPSETTPTGHTPRLSHEETTFTAVSELSGEVCHTILPSETTPTGHSPGHGLSHEATSISYTSSPLPSETTPTGHTPRLSCEETTFTEHVPVSELSGEVCHTLLPSETTPTGHTPRLSHEETTFTEHVPVSELSGEVCHTLLPSETTPTGHTPRLSHEETTFTEHVPVSELSGEVCHTSSQLPSDTTPTGHSPGHGLSHEATPISYTSSPLPCVASSTITDEPIYNSASVSEDLGDLQSKEYKLLKMHRRATELAVMSDMKWLAGELNDDDVAVLNDADVTEVKTLLNEEERAGNVVKALLNRVEQNAEELKTFIDILKKRRQKFDALIAKLSTSSSKDSCDGSGRPQGINLDSDLETVQDKDPDEGECSALVPYDSTPLAPPLLTGESHLSLYLPFSSWSNRLSYSLAHHMLLAKYSRFIHPLLHLSKCKPQSLVLGLS